MDNGNCFRFKIITSVTAVRACEWNKLCTEVNFSYEWFKTAEEARFIKALPQHILLYKGQNLVGICPGFIIDDDPRVNLDRIIFRNWHSLFNRLGFSFHPTFICYSRPHNFFSRMYLNSHVHRREVFVCLQKALGHIRHVHNIRSCAFFTNGDERGYVEQFTAQERHFFKIFFSYTTYQDVEAYDVFEDYLDDVKSRVGKKAHETIRYERNLFKKRGLHMEEADCVEDIEHRLCFLYEKRLKSHGKMWKFPSNLFSIAKRNLRDKLYLPVAKRDEEIKGFCFALVDRQNTKAMYTLFVGFDPSDKTSGVYFNSLFYNPIEKSIQWRLKKIYQGLSTYEAKMRRGCKVMPLYLLLNPLLWHHRFLVFIILPLVNVFSRRAHRVVDKILKKQINQ